MPAAARPERGPRRSVLWATGAAAAAVGLASIFAVTVSRAGGQAPRPAISVSRDWATAGTQVSVSGVRFPPRTTGTVSLGTLQVPFRTDADGGFRLDLTVPGRAGEVPLRAQVGHELAEGRLHVNPPGRVRFGVSTPSAPERRSELDAFEEAAGKAPSLVQFYRGFAYHRFDPRLVQSVVDRGALPCITWEPFDAARGVNQPEYRLRRIIEGEHDAYIRSWAAGIREWGGPLLLRFAHEMNGDWYAWAEAANGNRAGEYVAAWRHVHDIFRDVGATNVSWVWSPNVAYPGSTPMAGLYPGDAYVDWVGLDGYNWGTTRNASRWTSFEELFGPSLQELRAVAPAKPIMIAEVASAEEGGSKAAWMVDFFASLARRPEISAFVWFEHDKETDWRVVSSPAAAAAFAAGIGDPLYR